MKKDEIDQNKNCVIVFFLCRFDFPPEEKMELLLAALGCWVFHCRPLHTLFRHFFLLGENFSH